MIITNLPKGDERVHIKLEKTLILIMKIKEISSKPKTSTNELKVEKLRERVRRNRTFLTKLSTKAKSKVTRFYANIALKEISNKTKGILN